MTAGVNITPGCCIGARIKNWSAEKYVEKETKYLQKKLS
ncbi:hypothetical protein BN2497_965 [Janthinobacterium sp. CG23_2]|nr:hypothetical protein BN2497_965 [Janthinobacterium sp. CG23_2]CUU26880.1 hypothetical protein BN3177_965 [Janthinobacterium sp. CG23_2]